jgi:hypothetical protein
VGHVESLSHLQLNQDLLDELDQYKFQYHFHYPDLDCSVDLLVLMNQKMNRLLKNQTEVLKDELVYCLMNQKNHAQGCS